MFTSGYFVYGFGGIDAFDDLADFLGGFLNRFSVRQG